MADAKISALDNLTAADAINDMIPIVDVSATPPASGNTKRISINNLLSSSPTASGALTVTGLVTAGSATITGDLTVDTSTLKVDSTNNRVGIGTASPTAGIKLDIVSTTSDNFVRFTDSVNATGYLGVQASNSTVYLHGNNNRVSLSCSTSNTTPTEQLRITAPGAFEFLDGAGGTRMTLNSTGLGIGASPSYKLHVAASAVVATLNSTLAAIGSISTLLYRNVDGNSNTYSVASIACETAANGGYGNLIFSTGFNGSLVERMRIDLSGNLILQSSATPATLGTNGMLTVNATSNTNLRFSYRGSDGTTRVANITLA